MSDGQSQGSAEEGKEPSGALLKAHEELEHYGGECAGLVWWKTVQIKERSFFVEIKSARSF